MICETKEVSSMEGIIRTARTQKVTIISVIAYIIKATRNKGLKCFVITNSVPRKTGNQEMRLNG